MPKLSKSTSQFLFSNKIRNRGDQSNEEALVDNKSSSKQRNIDHSIYKNSKDDYIKAESSTPLKFVPQQLHDRNKTKSVVMNKNLITPNQGRSEQLKSKSRKHEITSFKDTADNSTDIKVKSSHSRVWKSKITSTNKSSSYLKSSRLDSKNKCDLSMNSKISLTQNNNSELIGKKFVNIEYNIKPSKANYANSNLNNEINANTANKRINEMAEIESESYINSVKGFLDNYYASNGYFAFSATKKDMSNKDVIHDKLQTFLDEKLLDITTLLSSK